jgi:hypothetical protein
MFFLYLLFFFSQEPNLFIDVLATVAGETEEELTEIITTYKDLTQQDRKYLIPVIGSLSELRIPEKQKVCAFGRAQRKILFMISRFQLNLLFETERCLFTCEHGSRICG